MTWPPRIIGAARRCEETLNPKSHSHCFPTRKNLTKLSRPLLARHFYAQVLITENRIINVIFKSFTPQVLSLLPEALKSGYEAKLLYITRFYFSATAVWCNYCALFTLFIGLMTMSWDLVVSTMKAGS